MEKVMNQSMSEALSIPQDRMPALRALAMPSDANPYGDVFGGWIMAQVDVAGAICAMGAAKGRVVTVAVNAMLFKERVFVGDLLSFFSKVTHIGKTSITVDVEVYAERNPEAPEVVKVTQAQLTYVSVDQKGLKRPIQA